MTPEIASREVILSEAVVEVLDEFQNAFALKTNLWAPGPGEGFTLLYPLQGDESGGPGSADGHGPSEPGADSFIVSIPTREGYEMLLEVCGRPSEGARAALGTVRVSIERLHDYAEEVRFFTYEVSERYEEINLLYSISETLGSLLPLEDASRLILTEVCEVMAANRGSLWVLDIGRQVLDLVASVGDEGRATPISTEDPSAVTAKVFREGRSLILSGDEVDSVARSPDAAPHAEPALSVPIRYTPPSGEPRTVGVLNLIGRRYGGRFAASDQKLLAAIASQVGAALENNRLVRESLERERVAKELELAHDLQMKLLPTGDGLDPERVAARVEPAESVGGDFYQFFRLPSERYGVMIGDVSSHGFPAALIMALSMSAATIYASEVRSPARVLREMGRALMAELESTEMYLTLFYGVVDPLKGELLYANAGHPHAFAIRERGCAERLPALDPPMGIAGEVEYEQRTVDWKASQDLLLLFTDGLSDDLVENSRLGGDQLVVDAVLKLRDRPLPEIVNALFELDRVGAVTTDDRTAVVLRA